MTQFRITPILSNAEWTGVTKPAIKEFVALTAPAYEAETIQEMRRRLTLDAHFKYLLRFKRIIIIQLPLQSRETGDFSQSHETNRSMDDYELTIKTGSYSDTKNVYDEMRDILIDQPTANANNKWTLGNMENIPQRGKYSYIVPVTGFLTGKPRDDNT